MRDALPKLTDLERQALRRVVNGEEQVGNKQLDNAVTRARQKLRAA